MNQQPAPISAGERMLLVLEAAAKHSRFSDIVTYTGLAKATVHRMLTQLLAAGYLELDDGVRYRPGPRLISLGGLALASVDVSEVATPIMDRLALRTGCAVNLVMRSGDAVVYLLRRHPDKPYRVSARIGTTNPLHLTATGKMMLADETDEFIAEYAERTGLPGMTVNSLTTLPALMEHIEAARVARYAIDDEESEIGVRCLAATALDASGQAVYALSGMTLAVEHSVADLKARADDIQGAAAELSRGLIGQLAPESQLVREQPVLEGQGEDRSHRVRSRLVRS